MKTVFVDTSLLVSVFEGDEARHDEAVQLLETLIRRKYRLIITDYIFDECITVINSRAGHSTAMQAGNFILNSNIVEFVWLAQEIKLRAWEYFVKHDDKGYSFTDCTSFMLMKEINLKYCLAFDKHFEQAGFRFFS